MKHPVALRLEPELLAAARACAKRENRTLTNFFETILKQHMMTEHNHSETSLSGPRQKKVHSRKRAAGEKPGARQ